MWIEDYQKVLNGMFQVEKIEMNTEAIESNIRAIGFIENSFGVNMPRRLGG